MSVRLPDRLAARRLYPGPWLRTIDVAACIIVAAILVIGLDRAIINCMARLGLIEEINGYIAWGAAYSLALIGTVWFGFVIIRGIPIADFKGAAADRRATLFALCWGVLGVTVSWSAFMLADQLIEWDRDHSFGIGPTTTFVQVATLFLFVALLGPLAEELIYRGVLFRWLRQRLSFCHPQCRDSRDLLCLAVRTERSSDHSHHGAPGLEYRLGDMDVDRSRVMNVIRRLAPCLQ